MAVQSIGLAIALHCLPGAYTHALGHLDTVHVLLLALLLVGGAGAGLTLCQTLELKQREAWMARRMLRAAATTAMAAASSSSSSRESQ